MSKTTCPMNHKAGVAPLNCPACHGSGFVTDSGTGEDGVDDNHAHSWHCSGCGATITGSLSPSVLRQRLREALPNADAPKLAEGTDAKEAPQPSKPLTAQDANNNYTRQTGIELPRVPSEAEGKPVPAPATPLPAERWRNKKTGTIYAEVRFNKTSIAEVRTEKSTWFPMKVDVLEPAPAQPLSESELDLSEESEQAQLLQEAYQLGFHDVRDGKLKPVLDKLNALIDRREAAARVDELEQVIIAHYAIEGAKRDRTFAEHLSARLASLREGGANGK